MSLQKLGRYELVRVLGKGAMGLVYEGRDPNLDRRVAIKTIKVENLSDEEAAEYEVRFRTEARSAARLQHPNIVSVYDSDRDIDIAYLVMEFIQGDDLKHFLDKGERYSLQQVVAIMNDLLSALGYAHRQNIVHRDIKPANLLIESSGRIKLTDFGVARIQDSGEATRTKGTMVGTLKYMSPEQVQGLPIDARSDLFSAGIVLYQLLTGARPFDGAGDYEIIQKIIEQPAPAPSTFNPNLPPEIDQVVARALEKLRDKRFPTAQEFNTALQAAAMSVADTTIKPPTSWPRPAESSTWTSTLASGESLVNTNSGSVPGVPASTVTQEVELVYWKEIKDSRDIEEYRDFLAKFPSGIYADLARRRLKRLASPGGDGGSFSGTRTQLMRPPSASGDEAAAGAASGESATPAQADSTEFEATRISAPAPSVDAVSEPPATEGPAPGKVADAVDAADDQGTAVAPTAAAKGRTWIFAVAGVVVLAAIGLGYQRLSRPPAPAPELAAQGPASTEPPKEEQHNKAAAAAPASRVPPPIRPTEHSKAAAPKAAPKPLSAAATAAPAESKKTVASPKPENKPVQAEAPKPAPITDPNAECEGRNFLTFQICMKEQCEKPQYAKHPVCEERRAMEQRNRASP